MMELLKVGEELIAQSGKKYRVNKILGYGGQGESYEVICDNQSYYLKWYYKSVATKEWLKIICELIEDEAPSEDFIWPLDYIEAHESYGCVCNLIPNEYHTFAAFLNRRVETSFKSLCAVGEKLAENLKHLHTKGYVLVAEYDFYFNPENGEVRIPVWEKVRKKDKAVSIYGTARYTAPEVLRGDTTPNVKSDWFIYAVYCFMLLMMHHPLEGKRESLHTCMDAKSMQTMYGTNPLFIYDKDDDSNRPVSGLHDNAIIFWNIYPKYVHDIFHKSFSKGCVDIEGRPTEREWSNVLKKLCNDIEICPKCGAEVFVENTDGKICWNCGSIVKKKSNNILKEIYSICPEIVFDKKKLKAYLLDYMYEEKTLRNIICLSFDEGIPVEIHENICVDNVQMSNYKKRLMSAYAIEEEMAERVIHLWVDALDK